MTDKQKKQKERRYLMRFKEVCSAFPDGEVRDCERPDFIISRTEGDLGIEITQLFQTPAPSKRPLQEQESLRKRIVDEAQSQYNLLGNRPIWVTIYFNHNYLLKKRDVKALGDKVAGIVQRNIPSPNGPAKDEVYDWVNRDYFPEQISRVSVRNGRKNLWSPSDFGFFPSLTPKEIQTELNRKNKLYKTYQKKCSSVWLIIVLDGSNLSSTFDVDDRDINAHVYNTAFDRVFLFENFSRRHVELLHTTWSE